jgi:hypothetical protein
MTDWREMSIGNDLAVGCLPSIGLTVLTWVNAIGQRLRQWFTYAKGVTPGADNQ